MSTLQQDYVSELQGPGFDIYKITNIEIIERELYNLLSDSKGPIREMCIHIMGAGGKRIRPLLVLCSGMIFSGLNSKLINAAAAAELIHMASLVHDDIIDESPLRRSKPSVNSAWGNQYAVLCGDYLFAKAFEVLSANRLVESMDYMVHAIKNMCHGEILQAGDRFSCNVGMKTYYERIAKKTAIFLECCCKSGAVTAGADEKDTRIIGEYGLNIGLAFQIVDDILDFYGDPKVMGKPRGEDLSQGNITIPIILLQRNKKYRGLIHEVIAKGVVPDSVMEEISAVLKVSGTIQEAFKIAEMHVNRAKYCLGQLPKTEHTDFLCSLADVLKSRMN